MKPHKNPNKIPHKKNYPVSVKDDAGSLAVTWGKRDDVPEDLRERLYPAVFEAFAAGDFNSVGMRDVSRLSGLSTATIYKYFKSKESLLTTVYSEVFPLISSRLSSSINEERSTQDNCKALFHSMFAFYDENPSLPIVFFVTVPTGLWMQSGGWRAREVVPIFEAILAAGKKSNELDEAINVSSLMGLFYMHVQREVHIWYLADQTWRMSERVATFFPQFWRAIQNTKILKSNYL